MGYLVQTDRQRRDPANPRASGKSCGHRNTIKKTMQAAGDDQIRRTQRMVRMAMSVDVDDTSVACVYDRGDNLLHTEKPQYAPGQQIPDARRVAEIRDRLGQ